jgi:hypothetical protein
MLAGLDCGNLQERQRCWQPAIHAELGEIQAKLDAYSIPQIEKTDWLPDDIKKVIIHGHPEEEDTPEQYFDTDGYTYPR